MTVSQGGRVILFEVGAPGVLPSLQGGSQGAVAEEERGIHVGGGAVGMSWRNWKWDKGDRYDPNMLYTCVSLSKDK